MAMKKSSEYTCPRCGGNNVECLDHDFDGEYMRSEMSCDDCDACWDEFFSLTYTGYAHDGVDYDKDGDEMYP